MDEKWSIEKLDSLNWMTCDVMVTVTISTYISVSSSSKIQILWLRVKKFFSITVKYYSTKLTSTYNMHQQWIK